MSTILKNANPNRIITRAYKRKFLENQNTENFLKEENNVAYKVRKRPKYNGRQTKKPLQEKNTQIVKKEQPGASLCEMLEEVLNEMKKKDGSIDWLLGAGLEKG